jgi:ketosteroid isomerase-like protein
MPYQASSDEEAIRHVIQQITASWLNKQYDDIGLFIAEHAVIAPPGSTARVRGRAAYIQSYRDYDQAATTLAFTPEEPEIDIIGDVAVALCPFVVVYELEGERHQAVGRDMLVLARRADAWQVIWRTMHTESAEPGTNEP